MSAYTRTPEDEPSRLRASPADAPVRSAENAANDRSKGAFRTAVDGITWAPRKIGGWIKNNKVKSVLIGGIALLFASPWILGSFAKSEGAHADAGLGWWRRFGSGLPRSPAIRRDAPLGDGLGGRSDF